MMDPSLAAILRSIENLKEDVADLKKSLYSAEQRIVRLETATFTPPKSPRVATSPLNVDLQEKNDSQDPPPLESVQIAEPLSKPKDRTEEVYSGNYAPKESECPDGKDTPCAIQTHIQPITDTLTLFSAQLNRIESALRTIKAGPSATPSPPEESLSRAPPPTAVAQPDLPTASHAKRESLNDVLATTPVPAAQITPVFGQVSTPSRRNFSFTVAGSPFGSYSSDASPFTRLTKKSTLSSGRHKAP